jgi:hypothetical protein
MYIYDPPLTDTDKEAMTSAMLEDLVYRTAFLSPKLRQDYIDRLRDVWLIGVKLSEGAS